MSPELAVPRVFIVAGAMILAGLAAALIGAATNPSNYHPSRIEEGGIATMLLGAALALGAGAYYLLRLL